MVSKASEDFPDPDNPVTTTRASRGMASVMSLRLCSRAPEITIWSPGDMSVPRLYERERAFPSRRAAVKPARRTPADASADARVDVVQQSLAIVEVEVLGQVAVRLRPRRAAQRHVQGDEPGPFGVGGV